MIIDHLNKIIKGKTMAMDNVKHKRHTATISWK
jgi:hypothetical protein